MSSLTLTASPVQPSRTGDRRLESIPTAEDGSLRPDLIPVAAYLVVEGYQVPEYCLRRLAAGQTAADLVRIGLLEPADRLAVEVLMSRVRPRGAAAAHDRAWRDARLAELNATTPGDDDFPAWPAF